MGLAEELESEAYIALGDERSEKLGELLRRAAERIRDDAHELDDTIASCDRLEAKLTEAREAIRDLLDEGLRIDDDQGTIIRLDNFLVGWDVLGAKLRRLYKVIE